MSARTLTERQQATYEYTCSGCQTTTNLTAAGGELDCTCKESSPHDLHATVVWGDGEREYKGTMAEITGALR